MERKIFTFVGVVKPLKQDIIKEIIYLTGQSQKQLLMTHL